MTLFGALCFENDVLLGGKMYQMVILIPGFCVEDWAVLEERNVHGTQHKVI